MSRDAKELSQIRRTLRENGYYNADEIINAIRTDMPNVRLPLKENNDVPTYHFMKGIVRMFLNKELTDGAIIGGMNTSLHYLASDVHIKEYDKDLNGLSAKEIIKRFEKVLLYDLENDKKRSSDRVYTKNNDYEIVKIDSYERATDFAKYNTWCICQSSDMYNSYTNNGSGLFYFVLKKGFENVERNEGTNLPLDEYGLSMIAVSIKANGAMNTITCRWNHEHKGNDSVMTVEEIENLIGMGFYEAFPPRTKEELLAMGISDKLGTYYNGGIVIRDDNGTPILDEYGNIQYKCDEYGDKINVEGIVVEVYPDETPKTIMSLNWLINPKTGDETMTWYDAMEIGNNGPWYLPHRDELARIMANKDFINANIKKLQDEEKQAG